MAQPGNDALLWVLTSVTYLGMILYYWRKNIDALFAFLKERPRLKVWFSRILISAAATPAPVAVGLYVMGVWEPGGWAVLWVFLLVLPLVLVLARRGLTRVGRVEISVEHLDGSQEPAVALLREKYPGKFFGWRAKTIGAVRLAGAADEHFPPGLIEISWVDAPYVLPRPLSAKREATLSSFLAGIASRGERPVWNGPCMRVIDASGEPFDASETKRLKLKLGPANWFDYVVANYSMRQELNSMPLAALSPYLDLEEVVRDGSLRSIKLATVAVAVAVVVTADGYALLTERSRGGTSIFSHFWSASVGEHLHPQKDPINAPGLPPPFSAVLRGIEEEISPGVREMLDEEPERLSLLGVAFSLDDFTPEFLFLALLPQRLETVLAMIRERPGKDFREGELRATLFAPGGAGATPFGPREWLAGGQAAVIRAREYITAVAKKKGIDEHRVLEYLGRRVKQA